MNLGLKIKSKKIKLQWIATCSLYCFCFFFTTAIQAKTLQQLGAVATQHPLASKSAERILLKGGNAIDAAIAAALTLSVVEPYNSGLGAGGLAMLWDEKTQQAFAIDFREKAPEKAHREMFQKQTLASQEGPLAIAVPGELAGLDHIHQKWGKLPWNELFADAIFYAEKGFAPSEYFKKRILKKESCLTRDSHTWEIYHPFFNQQDSQVEPLPRRQAPKLEEVNLSSPKLIQKNLAGSLKKIRDKGISPFYEGEIAQEMQASIQSKGGILTLSDLKNYQVIERPALKEKYSWGNIWTMPLPSSGGISVIRTLNTMEEIEKKWRALHKKSPEIYPSFESHWPILMVRVWDGVFKTRNQEMGDSDFVEKLPVKRWISQGLARRDARQIVAAEQMHFMQKTSEKKSSQSSALIRSLTSSDQESSIKTNGQTTHLSIIDRSGNAISMTLTQNLSFGSCVTAGKSGILMNNQMDDFAAHPGKANAFGLVQSEANAITAGKRPLSSMTPLIVTQKKQATLALGSPGGPRIISTVSQILFRHFHLNQEMKTAIAAPRFHFQGLPKKIFVEDKFFFQQNKKFDLDRELQLPWSNAQAVSFDIHSQNYQAWSDPRGIGKAIRVIQQ